MGLAGALLLAVALPVAAPSAASAYPGYTFSITCQGPGAGKANWSWWQGGLTGTDLAAASAICPTGGGTTSGTGIQPATADTLYAVVSAGVCGGGDAVHTWSFAPGSSISVKLSANASGSCGVYKTGGNEKADWALQS